jgi:ubiquinone/menaquinone biosynthesis C-methylase UbiE
MPKRSESPGTATAAIPDAALRESTVVFSAEGDERALVLQKRCRITVTKFGYVDSVEIRDGVVGVLGWAVDGRFEPPESILVIVNGKLARTSKFRQFERADVAAHLNLPPGVKAGFAVYAHSRSAVDSVVILAAFHSGEISELPGVRGVEPPEAPLAAPSPADGDEWRKKFSVPLVQFPGDSPFAGLFCTPSLYQQKPRGVTAQFLEDAAIYEKKYTSYQRWRALLNTAFTRVPVERDTSAVLDLGSGSGNSVIPALDLLPGADIVATDISPQLLTSLRRQLTPEQLQRCHLVVADASENNFTAESFDCVIGAAILHHLFDPADAIATAYQALRKGGHAIFFEPFEEGCALVRGLYCHLLDCKEKLHIADDAAHMFENVIRDLTVRTGMDKTDPIFDSMDDKWLFTRAYFERQQRACGFSRLRIFPLDNTNRPFSSQVATHLRLCLNKAAEALPPAAWQIVSRYDEMLSDDVRSEMLIEGCIVLTKEP